MVVRIISVTIFCSVIPIFVRFFRWFKHPIAKKLLFRFFGHSCPLNTRSSTYFL